MQQSNGYKRDLGLLNLVMLNSMGMIGSGWLFAEMYTSSYAGSFGSVFSWLLGGIIVLLISLTFMEVSSAFPRAGGSTPIGEFSHGKLVGFISGWGAWLSDVMTPPIEAIASVTYLSFFIKGVVSPTGSLEPLGYVLAVVIMVIILLVNLLSVKMFGNALTGVMVWKWAIPALVIVTLIPFFFHATNFTAYGSFYNGYSGVFYALVLGGVVFSFEGFRAAVNMAGEAKNKTYIWKSVIIALVLVMALYILLQIAFVGGIRWDVFGITPGDWGALSSSIVGGPFAQVASAVGLGWLVVILMIDAVISPGGAGISYAAYPSRIFQSMSGFGYAPKMFSKLSNKHVPARALVLGFVLGLFFIYEFPGWHLLIGILTSTLVIAYIVGPASINVLRKTSPKTERPFQLRYSNVIAPIAFVLTFLVVYWSGWPLSGEVVFATLAGLFMFTYFYRKMFEASKKEFAMVLILTISVVFASLFMLLFLYYFYNLEYAVISILVTISLAVYALASLYIENKKSDIIYGSWFIFALLAIEFLSLIGPSQYGGYNLIKFPYDFISAAVAGLLFYFWAQITGHRTKSLNEYDISEAAETARLSQLQH